MGVKMEKSQSLDDVVEHIQECLGADAVIVKDGNADDILEDMEKMGYEFDGFVQYVGGKRIRMMRIKK
jgi:hypothetical protein